ncbi:MAG TPA: nucleotide exchange factor GrpE [Phycisphaerae bacterium]|nr:nucleotide exchange factor GrpE [Phycisphaerae bacterium]
MTKHHHHHGSGNHPPQEDEQQLQAPDFTAAAEDAAQPERKTVEQERDDLLARLQRLGADYQNYQKRVQKDISNARDFANESLLRDLLSVLDDMERAYAAAQENHPADDPLLKGMSMVHDNLLAVLQRYGLTPIESVGLQFDPEKHAAMMQQPTNEVPPMTVLQEVQKGYSLKGRTIRPASVIVAKPLDETQPAE